MEVWLALQAHSLESPVVTPRRELTRELSNDIQTDSEYDYDEDDAPHYNELVRR